MTKNTSSYFFYCSFIFWTFSLGWICLADKIAIHKSLNLFHSNGLDAFFQVITHLGDGWTIVFVSVALLFVSVRLSILQIISYAGSGIISIVLKNCLFSDCKRPYYYLKTDAAFYKMSDFTYFIEHSFPSGHTTSIFALMTLFALAYNKSKVMVIVFFLCALLVAYSRIYLSQHFLIDVVAGSLIGTSTSYLVYKLFNYKLEKFNSPLVKLKSNHE
jgi:membrane-associated phospholipid phosphatase